MSGSILWTILTAREVLGMSHTSPWKILALFSLFYGYSQYLPSARTQVMEWLSLSPQWLNVFDKVSFLALIVLMFQYRPNLKVKDPQWIPISLIGSFIFLGIGLILTMIAIYEIFPDIALKAQIQETIALPFLIILSPVLEELIFRDFLLRKLTLTLNYKRAIILNCTVFSLFHLQIDSLDWHWFSQLMQYFMVSLFISFLYLKHGLIASILGHSLWNMFVHPLGKSFIQFTEHHWFLTTTAIVLSIILFTYYLVGPTLKKS